MEDFEILPDHKWMAELAVESELECMSVLYAKSLFENFEQRNCSGIFVGSNNKHDEKKKHEANVDRFIAQMRPNEKDYPTSKYSDEMSKNCRQDCKCKCRSMTSLSSTKDEECSTNDLEVATLTALSCSQTQSTQTDSTETDQIRHNGNYASNTNTHSMHSLDSCKVSPKNDFFAAQIPSSISLMKVKEYNNIPMLRQKAYNASMERRQPISLSYCPQNSTILRQRNLNSVPELSIDCLRSSTPWSLTNHNEVADASQMSKVIEKEPADTERSVECASSFSLSHSNTSHYSPQDMRNGESVMSQSWNEYSSGDLAFNKMRRPHRSPPPYTQLCVVQRGNRMSSQVMVNVSPQTTKKILRLPKLSPEPVRQNLKYAPIEPSTSSATVSLKSADSVSSSSIDSGQGSGEFSLHGNSNKEKYHFCIDTVKQRKLPSYARMANAMDQVLRISSSLYMLLNLPADSNTCRDLLAKTNILIHIIQASPSAYFLSDQDITELEQIIDNLQLDRKDRSTIFNNRFSVALQKLLRQIICQYLMECSNKDRLLVIALEHLIHVLLFGEDLRLAAIQLQSLKTIYTLCQLSNTPTDTLRLLLRALAVLCNTSQGTQQLISLGGLDMITRILCTSSIPCGVEAAGVLTQLTNPNRSLIKLSTSIDIITARLLDIIDDCTSGESLLLCVAALANLSLQSHSVVSVLYQHNAVKRLITALSRPKCSTMFVQEQVVTVFSRMATQDYEEALIAQGAIPVLFSMLSTYDSIFAEYSRRIQYKAALCLGTISSKGVGLKAVHQNNGYSIISRMLKMEGTVKTPVEQICRTIKEQLEAKYELESAV